MVRILTVVGARPQFIKASAISRCIHERFSTKIRENILHTGQHYDELLSDVFFQQMQIPAPAYHLQAGSASHGKQTAVMLEGIEEIIQKDDPDVVLVYGDTNSTLAASLAAAKLHVPVAHVEAGLRSFNKKMPEEVNRIVTDHLSSFLFTPTHQAYLNLEREGLKHLHSKPVSPDNPVIINCGDVMYDNVLYFEKLARKHSTILTDLNLEDTPFILCTFHRDFNTDHPQRLKNILEGLIGVAQTFSIRIIVPLHPRTKNTLNKPEFESISKQIHDNKLIEITHPLPYFDILQLLASCKMTITDSGGLQKEAYFLKKPVAILRAETEWTEIIESGNGWLTDDDPLLLLNACKQGMEFLHGDYPLYYGDGDAAGKILETLTTYLS